MESEETVSGIVSFKGNKVIIWHIHRCVRCE